MDPDDNITAVDFCSDWDYYTPLPNFPALVTVNHTAITADPGGTFGSTNNFVTSYTQIFTHTFNLGAHGGDGSFVPGIMVSLNGIQYPQGAPIQTSAQGGRRMVSFYCDNTNLYLFESARPGPIGLAAKSLTYRVAPFINTADVPGEPLFDADIEGGRIRMGKGRIDTNNPIPMREAIVGDTNILALPNAESLDVNNGRIRMALSDGEVQDVGPIIGFTAYHGSFTNSLSKQTVV
jgi:hypothetical protein